jgi:hypothetical protein
MEIWKEIEGYEGLYKVSNKGNVKGVKRNKNLKMLKDSCGYSKVNLCKDGKLRSFLVHRLVALAFLENTNNLPQINHIDEDKNNNKVDNLEWCTCEYNITYGTRSKRMVSHINYKNSKEKKKRKVLGISLDGTKQLVLDSMKSGLEIGFNPIQISHCCTGRRKTHKGYVWKYI